MAELKVANNALKGIADNEYLLSCSTERTFWNFIPKRNDLYGFFFVMKGSVLLTVNGNETVAESGDILFFKPNDICSVAAVGETVPTLAFCACEQDIFNSYVTIYGQFTFKEILEKKENIVLHANSAEQTAISQRIEQFLFFKNIPQSGEFFKKVIFHRFLELLLQSKLNITPQNPHFYLIDLLKNIDPNEIVTNGISAILERTNVSHEHLCRIMKKSLGITPLDYVTNIRMQRACDLLLHTESDISSIALLTGYSSQSHFISAFKKKYNLTPAAYRKSNLSK